MATRPVATPQVQNLQAQQRNAQNAAAAQRNAQTLGMANPLLAGNGLVNPYGAMPVGGLQPGMLAPGAGPLGPNGQPQVNATNQSALAPNGNINQEVRNENQYENRFFNIIASPYSGGGFGPGFGMPGWGRGHQCVIDPLTGGMHCQRSGGVLNWLRNLIRGY